VIQLTLALPESNVAAIIRLKPSILLIDVSTLALHTDCARLTEGRRRRT
jgi:hypothetical protein